MKIFHLKNSSSKVSTHAIFRLMISEGVAKMIGIFNRLVLLVCFIFSYSCLATEVAPNFKTIGSGTWIKIPRFQQIPESDYLNAIANDLKYYQNNAPKEARSSLKTFTDPGTAVIVGAGTVGMYALSFAADSLKAGSTIILLQNDTLNVNELQKTITQQVPAIKEHHLVISPPYDIAELDKIEGFLSNHQAALEETQLYIHTADKAYRIIPDSLSYEDVLPQIIRRMSVAAINDYIVSRLDNHTPYWKILVSSECAQNRSDYKIPNLGPYQIGKIVGDELFKASKSNKNTYALILYSGPMATLGQKSAREDEYHQLAALQKKTGSNNATAYVQKHFSSVDINPMGSVGTMLSVAHQAMDQGKLKSGQLYTIYGNSVNPALGFKANKLYEVANVDYMWPKLEG